MADAVHDMATGIYAMMVEETAQWYGSGRLSAAEGVVSNNFLYARYRQLTRKRFSHTSS
jgi:hypothetical protein